MAAEACRNRRRSSRLYVAIEALLYDPTRHSSEKSYNKQNKPETEKKTIFEAELKSGLSSLFVLFKQAGFLNAFFPSCVCERGNFYPKKVIQKKLFKNKPCKNFYPEVLSSNVFIQNVRDLFYVTL